MIMSTNVWKHIAFKWAALVSKHGHPKKSQANVKLLGALVCGRLRVHPF